MPKRNTLKAARKKKCGSQQVLADMLPVSRTEVSNWERAKTTPQPHWKEQLGEVLEYKDLDALLKIDYTDEELSKSRDTLPPVNEAPPSTPTQASSGSRLWVPYVPTLQDFVSNNMSCHFWQIAHTDYDTPEEMTASIQAALKEFNRVNRENPTYKVTRRNAMWELASLPWIALGRHQTLPSRRYEEMLRYCTAAFEGCWDLYQSSDPASTQHAFKCVCTYIPILETIAHDSAQHRKQALDLGSQYAILQTLLGWSCAAPWETVGYAQNALSLCEATDNILLQLSAYPKLGTACFRGKQYKRAYDIMQKGESILKDYQRKKNRPQVPSGMVGNFYSSYALIQTKAGISPARALGKALDSEPLSGRVALVEFTVSSQWNEVAEIYCSNNDPAQAMKWIERRIDRGTLAPRPGVTQSENGRIRAINILTTAWLQSEDRDMGKIIEAWTKAMEGANALKNESRYQEAMDNLTIMQELWRGEQAIGDLIPMTAHW